MTAGPHDPEAELDAAWERYGLVVQAANDPIWEYDLVSGRIDRSEALGTTFGYGSDEVELTERWWSDKIHPEDRERVVTSFRTSVQGRANAWTQEYRFRHADGRYVEVFDRGIILRDPDGKAIRMAGSMLDLTERRRLQVELDLYARRQAAVADLGLRALRGEPTDQLLRSATRFVADLLKVDFVQALQVLPGREHFVLRAGVGWPETMLGSALMEAGERTPAGYAFIHQRPVIIDDLPTEQRFRAPPLMSAQEAVSAASVVIPGRHEPWGVLSVYSKLRRMFTRDDIVFLQETANALASAIDAEHSLRSLREREERFEALLSSSTDAIVLADPDGQIAYASAPIWEIGGLEPVELVGRAVRDMFRVEDRSRTQALIGRALAQPESSITTVLRIGHPSRGMRFVEVTAKNASDVPQMEGVIFGIRDVTERLEELEAHRQLRTRLDEAARLQGLGRMAGGIAHDFNNFLAVIQNYAEAARRRAGGDERLLTDLSRIAHAVERAGNLTRDLLTLARVDFAHEEVVDLGRVIADARPLLEESHRAGIRLEIVPTDRSFMVSGDEGHLERVVLNLALNAYDAIPGEGTVEIRVDEVRGPEPEERRYARVSVLDSGVGMTPDVLECALDPFFTTKPEGTGIGLTIVHAVVHRMGGRIEISSRPAGGTHVDVYLPLIEAAEGV